MVINELEVGDESAVDDKSPSNTGSHRIRQRDFFEPLEIGG